LNQADGKREAQRRADRIRAFREELAQLEQEQVLTLDEAQRAAVDEHLQRTLAELTGRFDVDATDSQKQFSWGMRIASTLAGMALCAAIVLFFVRFWGDLSTGMQVFVLVSTTLALLAATDFAARKERTLYYASLLSLMTFGAFVLNLNALGSTFNLTPTRNALLAWCAFGLLLAYLYRLLLPLTAGLLCGLCFVASGVASWWGGHPLAFTERPENFLAGGVLLVATPFLPGQRKFLEFNWVYRVLGLVTLLLAILVLSEAGQVSYLRWSSDAVEKLYQVLGFGVSGAAIWLGVRERLKHVTNLGAGFFTVLLYLRFFHWWWDWMPGYLFCLILGVFSIGLLVLFRKLRARMAEEVAI